MSAPTTAQTLFAQNVKHHRSRLGVSQVELSRAAGLGPHRVANIENSAANVRLDTVNRLAIALDVDPCLLLSPAQRVTRLGYVERSLPDAVANNLKKLRNRLGLSQQEVNTAAGLGWNYVYKVETLRVVVTLSTLEALARAVDVSTWQLLS
jgi:transcriptional regulator with XRE-family HTH domain